MSAQRLVCVPLLFTGIAAAGINWKSVWLEPRAPIVLTAGEAKPYTVMGRSGADTKSDLTKSENLKITSSDPGVLEIDRENGRFVAGKPGHADIRISFGEASEMVPAFVRVSTTVSGSSVDGVWRAEFTGDWGEQPKMVSEIFFDVTANGKALNGTVHAADWPGDAILVDGAAEGNRVSFAMVGHLPFWAQGSAGYSTGYPKLCFNGVRNGGEMKVELLWTEARLSCDTGKPYPMAAKRVGAR